MGYLGSNHCPDRHGCYRRSTDNKLTGIFGPWSRRPFEYMIFSTGLLRPHNGTLPTPRFAHTADIVATRLVVRVLRLLACSFVYKDVMRDSAPL